MIVCNALKDVARTSPLNVKYQQKCAPSPKCRMPRGTPATARVLAGCKFRSWCKILAKAYARTPTNAAKAEKQDRSTEPGQQKMGQLLRDISQVCFRLFPCQLKGDVVASVAVACKNDQIKTKFPCIFRSYAR